METLWRIADLWRSSTKSVLSNRVGKILDNNEHSDWKLKKEHGEINKNEFTKVNQMVNEFPKNINAKSLEEIYY